jgi:RNA polymerase sigma factor (sigma-70 family)
MTSRRLETTWRSFRALLGATAATAITDAQLLARFVAHREEAAFAELVRRHGALVHGVCRRVLGNAHDADDAFQATFLVLSHKAASVRNGDCLASWLHGVALHTAISHKRSILRRKEQGLPENMPQSETDDVSWREVLRLLDEELARLPEQFRQPLILCYLEGKTRDEAADELGWSPTTFRGRLERARERLRRRLERRGLTLSAALLATLAVHRSEAATFSLTKASAPATTLATEVLRTMFMAKMKSVLVWCIAVLFISAGVGATAYHCVAVEPGAATEAKSPPTTKKSATPPEKDGIVKDYQAHLEQFRLTITLRPQQQDNSEARYPVSELRLHVSADRIAEQGSKSTVFARITEEQAAKIVEVLARDNFFRDSVADPERLTPPKGNYVELWASYRKDDDSPAVKRWHMLDWDAHLIQQLEALRQCVDGEAARHLDTLLQLLKDDMKQEDKANLLTIAAVDDLDALRVVSERQDKRQVVGENKQPEIEKYVLDGVLPFDAWPKDLSNEQLKLRADGLKLAQTWLLKRVVQFQATRGPRVGDVIRYAAGPTRVAQEWKGQTPAELFAKDAFHINVLLIQEGYSPFVHMESSRWDKNTLTCYESAEQYAKLHQKGIWKDAEFAERLKKIAEKRRVEANAVNTAVEIPDALIAEMLQKDPFASQLLREQSALEKELAAFRERLINPEKNAQYQHLRNRLEELQQQVLARRAELAAKNFEELLKKDPKVVALETKIRSLEMEVAEWHRLAAEPEKQARYQLALQAIAEAQSELLKLRAELRGRLQK